MDLYSADRILLCLRYGIGDLVMELPVIEGLRRTLPGARLTALGAEPAIELLYGSSYIDEVIPHTRWGFRHFWDEGSPDSQQAFEGWLERSRFDVCLDAVNAPLGIRQTLYRTRARVSDSSRSAEARHLAAGAGASESIARSAEEGWGLPMPSPARPKLGLTRNDRNEARCLLEEHGMAAAKPVAVSPIASHPLKQWPVERFARVCDSIAKESEHPLLVFAGPQGTDRSMLIERIHPSRAILIPPMPLKTTAALLECSILLLSNDTGLMHMAAAVGTPVVAIFGPTNPGFYLPRGPHHRALPGSGADCPYYRREHLGPPGCWTSEHCLVGDESCIASITTEQVVTELKATLEAVKQSTSRSGA